jgi:transposase
MNIGAVQLWVLSPSPTHISLFVAFVGTEIIISSCVKFNLGEKHHRLKTNISRGQPLLFGIIMSTITSHAHRVRMEEILANQMVEMMAAKGCRLDSRRAMNHLPRPVRTVCLM